jgi:hypothetical protein
LPALALLYAHEVVADGGSHAPPGETVPQGLFLTSAHTVQQAAGTSGRILFIHGIILSFSGLIYSGGDRSTIFS